LVDYIIFFPGAGSGAYSQAKAIYNVGAGIAWKNRS